MTSQMSLSIQVNNHKFPEKMIKNQCPIDFWSLKVDRAGHCSRLVVITTPESNKREGQKLTGSSCRCIAAFSRIIRHQAYMYYTA